MLAEALRAGVPAVQLREKDLGTRALLELAEDVLRLTQRAGAKLLINDRIDLVAGLHADGVHLRSSSVAVTVARRILGTEPLIGISVHGAEEVIRAEAEGADFAVLGPIYDTPSKLGYGPPIGIRALERASRRSRIPLFAIGGITARRTRDVLQAGAHGVAVISSILTADSVATATQALLDSISTGG